MNNNLKIPLVIILTLTITFFSYLSGFGLIRTALMGTLFLLVFIEVLTKVYLSNNFKERIRFFIDSLFAGIISALIILTFQQKDYRYILVGIVMFLTLFFMFYEQKEVRK